MVSMTAESAHRRSDRILAIQKTRKITSEILVKALAVLEGKTETAVRDEILKGLSTHAELYPTGWYDPPPSGTSVLWSTKPFERLQYNSLRDKQFWPNNSSRFEKETVGHVYASSVDRQTNMIGDVALTIYAGTRDDIKKHIRACHDAILNAAEYLEVGKSLSDIYTHAIGHFQSRSLKIGWMTTVQDPYQTNLGHTIPGSYGEELDFGGTFFEIREAIRTKRIFINEGATFKVPSTCAVTIEARLVDTDERLPNILFHFIVTFSEGKKKICANFDDIFSAMDMKYMYD